jgi:hypothetical protein
MRPAMMFGSRDSSIGWLAAFALAAACGKVEVPAQQDAAAGEADAAPGGDAPEDLIDDQTAEFAGGTFLGTRVVGDRVELDDNESSGDFVSRVHDSGVEGVTWAVVGWTPGAPYGKPLPDDGRTETGYPGGTVDMTDNVLLLHLDQNLSDTSPIGTPVESVGPEAFVAGRFGDALDDGPEGYVRAGVDGPDSVFNFGTGSFTWALWARSTAACPGNAVYMGIENPGTGLQPHLWLGCTPIEDSPDGTVGNTFCSTRTKSSDCATADGEAPLTDGGWHHLAIVKSGHESATVTAYLDGVVAGEAATSFLNPIVFDTGVEFALGAFSAATFPAEGAFDEAAVWRRALDADEVSALYGRGTQRLSFQVRACDEPTCNGVEFVGPGGDPAGAFEDPAGALEPPDRLSLGVVGRYLQYRVHIETDDPARSPSIHRVRIAAR